MRAKWFIIPILATLLACNQPSLKYPKAKKVDVTDNYFGNVVADPYRWLEDLNSRDAQAWIAAQNRLTFGYLHSSPAYERIKKRLKELWNYTRFSAPSHHGHRYFFWKNDGLQNQSVLYVQESLDSPARVLLDPNQLSTDGTIAVTQLAISKDGRLMAYALSKSGSDWQKIHIKNIDNGKDYPEVLKWCKFSSIAWRHDNKGFYYNRFPAEGTVPYEDRNNFNRVYFHVPGTPQKQDRLIYKDDRHKEWGFSPIVSEDGRFLILHVWEGTNPNNRILIKPLDKNEPFTPLFDKGDASYSYVFNEGPVFYFRTDKNAPRGKIISFHLTTPQQWREIIPQQKDVLDYAVIAGNHLVVNFMHNAHDVIKMYTLQGAFKKEIPLPTFGSIYSLSGEKEDDDLFITFASFLYPPTIFRYRFSDDHLTIFRKTRLPIELDNYQTQQVFYYSKDSTRVPMFITHKKGLSLQGNNPTILYGYGGFDVNIKPSFSVSRLLWLEQGGVYAVANIRGGGEFGEEWHRAGMLHNKQNVFDDFISAAQYLIQQGYTNSQKLAIQGASNGGLLVAAVMTQRPALFGAVLCQVPVIDMLRYHKFTVGRYWIPEYGNAEQDSAMFHTLYAYSPLHNVKKGTCYPPTLITTAESDNRVHPLHALKFTAALQEAQSCKNPILLRVETKAGHGAGKPTAKRIEEVTDLYTFLFKIFQMD